MKTVGIDTHQMIKVLAYSGDGVSQVIRAGVDENTGEHVLEAALLPGTFTLETLSNGATLLTIKAGE